MPAVADRDSPKVAYKIVILLGSNPDDLQALGDAELRGDHPDRTGRAKNEQGLAP